MNSNFNLKFKLADVFIIAASLIISIILIIVIVGSSIFNSSNDRYVKIYYNDTILNEYTTKLNDLNQTKIVKLTKEKYPKLLEDFTIEIDPEKGIRVKDVTCYDHTCVKQGWVNISNLPIVCIPNNVRVIIINNDDGLGDIILGGYIFEFKY